MKSIHLIFALTRREVDAKYKGSFFGLTWALLSPLLMVMVYAFVFGEIFQSKWPGARQGGGLDFAIALFVGLIPFSFVSEVISRAPTIIVGNPSYVKKVVFPLHYLSVVTVLTALVQLGISLMLLLVLLPFSNWEITVGPLLISLVILIPLVLFSCGMSWMLSSIGVYARDISQLIGPVLTVVMFLSPIFYDLKSVSPDLRWLYYLNPLTYVVEGLRMGFLSGGFIGVGDFLYLFCFSLFVFLFGLLTFKKLRNGFADVL